MKLQKLQASKTGSEDVFNQYLDKWSRKTSTYDCLLFFSGGKDSSYLALKLKQMGKRKICLFTVDNGFEEDNFIDHARQVASGLELELKICTPPVEEFETLFKFVLKELSFDDFKEYSKNPICIFCMFYIWAQGMKYAEENDIPVVLTAHSPSQLRLPPYSEAAESEKASFIKIVEKYEILTRKNLKRIHEKVKLLKGYQNNPILKKIMDQSLVQHWNTLMIFPFQFLDYNVEKILKTLEEETTWQPPNGTSINTYFSTGCQLWNIFLLLEKKYGYEVKERGELEDDLKEGRIRKERYDEVMKMAETFEKGIEITPVMEKLLKRLGIEKDFL
jgi:hypothetical protein